jgi:hypothetical protein
MSPITSPRKFALTIRPATLTLTVNRSVICGIDGPYDAITTPSSRKTAKPAAVTALAGASRSLIRLHNTGGGRARGGDADAQPRLRCSM